MTRNCTLVIGEIVGTHGIRGVVKVRSYAESSDIFLPDTLIFIGKEKEEEKKPFTIQWVKSYKKGLIMAFDEVATCTQAEALVHSLIYIDPEMLPDLADDTYYWHELIGLSVFSVENGFLGQVASIIPTGSNDVLVLKDPAKGPQYERLIPVLASVVKAVNLAEKRIEVALPEGL